MKTYMYIVILAVMSLHCRKHKGPFVPTLSTIEEENHTPEQAQELVDELGYSAGSSEGRLITAIFVNDTSSVDQLIKSGVNFNFKSEDTQLPLASAINNGNNAIVKLLLDTKKFDPNFVDEEGYTPLLMAGVIAGGPMGTQGHIDIVKSLLNAGANPRASQKGDIGKTFKDSLKIDSLDTAGEKQRKLSLQKIVTDFEALQPSMSTVPSGVPRKFVAPRKQ